MGRPSWFAIAAKGSSFDSAAGDRRPGNRRWAAGRGMAAGCCCLEVLGFRDLVLGDRIEGSENWWNSWIEIIIHSFFE